MAKDYCPWCKHTKPDAYLRKLEEAGLGSGADSFCWYGIRAGAVCVDKEGVARCAAHGGLRVVGYVDEGRVLRLSVANPANEAVLIGSVQLDDDECAIARAIASVCRAMVSRHVYGRRVAHAEQGKDEIQVILRADEPPEDFAETLPEGYEP